MCQVMAQEASVTATDALLEHLVRRHLAGRSDSCPESHAGRGGIPLHRLRRVLEGIDREMARPLRLDDLADLAGMSRFHFAREFARTTGVSPHRFVVRRRLQRAVELLASRTLQISDVARLSGFTHASHLARHMYRQNGVTPRSASGTRPPVRAGASVRSLGLLGFPSTTARSCSDAGCAGDRFGLDGLPVWETSPCRSS